MVFRFQITTGNKTPIYRQIVNQVAQAAALGQLQEGDELPSVRRLADHLVVNPNTVAKAYRELSRDGVIESQQGKGYTMARRSVFSDEEKERRLSQALGSFISEASILGFTKEELKKFIKESLDKNNPKGES